MRLHIGVTGFVVIAVFPLTRDHLKGVRNTFRNCVKSKHISVFAAGGAILGMGMTLCGSVSVSRMVSLKFLSPAQLPV